MGLLDALRDPQFRSDVGTNTRNLFQQASNSAASNVTAPVDIMAWLLRRGGVPVPQNPMGGSDWAKDAGFTREVPDGAPKVAGDTLGMLALLLGAGKSKEIAGGLLKADESLKPVAGRMVDRYMDKIGGKQNIVPQNFTYHASPVKLDLKDKYGKGYDELYDLVHGEASNSLSPEKWEQYKSLLKKYERGNLGNNAGKQADQLYTSSQPEAWRAVQQDELNVPYSLGGIYGLEMKSPIKENMTQSGMGQFLPESIVNIKDILRQVGPFTSQADAFKALLQK